MRKVILAMIVSASAMTAQAAAAQEQARPAPAEAPPTTIVYPDKGPSGMSDYPMGTHRIPDSNVYISGHQKGGVLGLALFGMLGAVVQSEANAAAGKGAVRDVQDDLRFDVTARAREMTGAILAAEKYGRKFTLSPDAGGGTLSVVPYVAITFVNETDVRPYIVLKTTLSAASPGGAPRTVKYFCCEAEAQPLAGENGLTANDGANLKKILASELETAIQVMLMDRSGTYARGKGPTIRVVGYLPFMGKPLKAKGHELGRYEDYVLYDLQIGGGVNGVHIAEPSAFKIKSRNRK